VRPSAWVDEFGDLEPHEAAQGNERDGKDHPGILARHVGDVKGLGWIAEEFAPGGGVSDVAFMNSCGPS
jgi:hypothetical protein